MADVQHPAVFVNHDEFWYPQLNAPQTVSGMVTAQCSGPHRTVAGRAGDPAPFN